MKQDITYLLRETNADKLIDGDVSLISKNKNVRLKDDDRFLDYARRNRWADRRDREKPLPWRMDVFDFILMVYDPWLGKGLMQGDLKVADPSVYAEMHKKLSALRREGKPIPDWINETLPSEAAVRDRQLDSMSDRERERLLMHREFERERSKARRRVEPIFGIK